MKRLQMALLATVAAAGLGCAHERNAKESASRAWDSTVEGAKTVGTATAEGAKTVGGTTRGFVKGGTAGAKQEYNVGADTTSTKTRQKAGDTAAAARGEPYAY
jgi:predicted ribonuclease toxin of YeeF-YezG toxin-antitoxin module